MLIPSPGPRGAMFDVLQSHTVVFPLVSALSPHVYKGVAGFGAAPPASGLHLRAVSMVYSTARLQLFQLYLSCQESILNGSIWTCEKQIR